MVAVESRKHPRYKAEIPACISAPAIEGTPLPTTVKEIGLGGCLFRAEASFEQGRILPINITLGGQSLFVVARVLYRRTGPCPGNYHGVEFVDIAPEDQDRLGQHLESLSCALKPN